MLSTTISQSTNLTYKIHYFTVMLRRFTWLPSLVFLDKGGTFGLSIAHCIWACIQPMVLNFFKPVLNSSKPTTLIRTVFYHRAELNERHHYNKKKWYRYYRESEAIPPQSIQNQRHLTIRVCHLESVLLFLQGLSQQTYNMEVVDDVGFLGASLHNQ